MSQVIRIEEEQEAQRLLQALWLVAQPQVVVHVGIGRGSGLLAFWQQFEPAQAVLIDADPERAAPLASYIETHPGWHIRQALVGDGAESTYHCYNLAEEDGLYGLEELVTLWPAIKLREKRLAKTQTLDELLPMQADKRLCSVIDALPAARIIQGATRTLDNTWLAIVRVRLDGNADAADLSAVRQELKARGLNLLAIVESTHPVIGHAIFMRDLSAWQERSDALLQAAKAREEQAQQRLAALQAEHGQSRNELAQSAEREKALIAARDEAQAELKQAQAALHEAQARIAALENDLQAAKAREEQAQQQLALLREECERNKNALVQYQETQHRQQLMQEELIRAEAQIELIKDLLLREPGL